MIGLGREVPFLVGFFDFVNPCASHFEMLKLVRAMKLCWRTGQIAEPRCMFNVFHVATLCEQLVTHIRTHDVDNCS